jgi:threonyl-tRNA synthetase
VQVDFYQPERFDLRHTGPDGVAHRPVMVHGSVVGSIERVVAHLVEVHGGAFPAWLAPTQVVVLPVSDAQVPHAARFAERCVDRGLRARVAGLDGGSLGARIRAARLVPYHAVIGASEAGGDRVALRLRDGRRLDPLPAAEVVARVAALTGAHSLDLWDADARVPPGR